jgi:hypothetical protein
MIQYSFAVLIFIFSNTASAEYLMFHQSTTFADFHLTKEIPIFDADGKDIGFIKSYSFSSQSTSKLKSMMIETKVIRNPDDGPIEHNMAIANKFSHDCEDVYFDNSLLKVENKIKVAYSLIFCTNHRTLGGGVIKSVKSLQGKRQMFTVSREWYVPAFRMPLEFSNFKDLVKSVFKSSELGSAWQNEYDSTFKFLVRSVILCATRPGDFGGSCTSAEIPYCVNC